MARNRKADYLTSVGAPAPTPLPIQWLPWHQEALRLHFSLKNSAQIARALGRDESVVLRVMKSEEWSRRAQDLRARMDSLWEQRMLQLWELSPDAIEALKKVIGEYEEVYNCEPDPVTRQGMKGFRAARQDAMDAVKQVLDRVGLKAPEKVEVTSESHHTETTETKLTYEQRLELVELHKKNNMTVPEDLCILELEGTRHEE